MIEIPEASKWSGCSPKQLRTLLARHRITQKKAAAMIGVDPRSVTRWLSGDAKMHYAFWFTLVCKLHPSAKSTGKETKNV